MANVDRTPEFLAQHLQACADSFGDVDAFVRAMEREHGRELAEAGYNLFCSRLPGLSPERRAELAARAAAYQAAPEAYKLVGRDVAEWTCGMYRFYCTIASWPYSPAARGGYILKGV